MAITLQRDFEKAFGIQIPDTALFDYPNIRTMAHFILRLIPFASLEHAPVKTQESYVDTSIDLMSSDEVMKTLDDLLDDVDEEGG